MSESFYLSSDAFQLHAIGNTTHAFTWVHFIFPRRHLR